MPQQFVQLYLISNKNKNTEINIFGKLFFMLKITKTALIVIFKLLKYTNFPENIKLIDN